MDAVWHLTCDCREWGATMKYPAMVMGFLALLATRAAAGDGGPMPASPYNGVNTGYMCTPWGAVMPASRPTTAYRPMQRKSYAQGGCESCGAIGDRGSLLERLWGFAFYRATIPCDWCPRPTTWEPPLYLRFPNVCHAAIGGCAEPCTRNWMMGPCRGGCATCAASLGKPLTATTTMMARQGISTPYAPAAAESGTVTMRAPATVRAPMNLQANARYPQPNLLPAMFQQPPLPLPAPSYPQPVNQVLPQRP